MSLALLATGFIALLTAGYFLYGTWLRKQLVLDDATPTPAVTKNDGVDFVPTRPCYLFGQHFSAIAAAGPIVGPITACLTFGWLPCLLWIAVGVVLIGAVHDFVSLTASVRNGGSSIAEIARRHISPSAGNALMAFIWIALLYIIVAFADVTASSFVWVIDEMKGVKIDFNPGGAVAAASVMYLALSLIMGLVQRFLNPPLWLLTLIFVPLAFATSWFGTQVSTLFLFDQKTWAVLIVLYCAIGSVAPVWLLLQPRGFLGGFILYFALAAGVIGIFFGGYEIQQPAWTGGNPASPTGALFPFLFVTIACGACSGFHGLVCSGTTSKQVQRETHMHPVGYGAMLAEGFVAFIALAIVMIMTKTEVAGLKPGTIYGNGIGQFITLVIGKEHLPFAITFGAMAFSTFVFDTLDVSTRLGRYIIQELTGWKTLGGAIFGTVLTIGVPAGILFLTPDGAWVKYWTLFGASNQLLAGLTLMAVSAWLVAQKKPALYTLIPMVFVLVITTYALYGLATSSWAKASGLNSDAMNAVASASLIVLAVFVVLAGTQALKRARQAQSST